MQFCVEFVCGEGSGACDVNDHSESKSSQTLTQKFSYDKKQVMPMSRMQIVERLRSWFKIVKTTFDTVKFSH